MTVHDPTSHVPRDAHLVRQGEDSWQFALQQGDSSLREWVLSHPADAWSDDPALLLAMAATYRWEGAAGAWTALPYLEAAESLIDAAPDTPPRARAAAALLRCLSERSRGDMVAALDHVTRALGILQSPGIDIRDRLDLTAPALVRRGTIRTLLGDLAAARVDLERGLVAGESRLTARKSVEAWGFLAIIEVLAGSLSAADHAIRRTRAVADRISDGLWTAPLTIAELLVSAERGSLSADRSILRRLSADVEGSELEFFAHHLRVLLAEETGDVDARVEAVRRMRVIERSTRGFGLLALLHRGDRIEALLAVGDLARANFALGDRRDDHHVVCTGGLRARAALMVGDHERALSETRQCLAEEDHPIRSLLSVAAVDAAAHDALGDLRSADVSFGMVLREAASSGARRVFRDIPPSALERLLDRAGARDLSVGERDMVVQVAASIATRDGAVDGAGVASVLSARERVVLARLAAGESPRTVALALHVSVNTVKTQMRSIYRKLGASTRAGALERARSLGVLAA